MDYLGVSNLYFRDTKKYPTASVALLFPISTNANPILINANKYTKYLSTTIYLDLPYSYNLKQKIVDLKSNSQ